MKPRFLVLTVIVLAAALWRVLPHPWNLTPVAAMALFAGAHFSNQRAAYVVPLAAVFLSNLVLGSFYNTAVFVYASFALTVFIGTLLRRRRDALSIVAGSLGSSLAFFLITNAGHWAVSGEYARSTSGFLSCMTAAVPFFRNTLVGDLGFTAVFFGGFALLERRYAALRDPQLNTPLSFLPR